MFNREADPRLVMPDPIEVARRVALSTGDSGISPDIELSPTTRQEVFFSLADDRQTGSAVVNLKRFATTTRLVNGQEVPEWSGGRYAHIGYFNPAEQAWKFYPEYIKDNEKQRLSEAFDEMGEVGTTFLRAEAEEGKPFVDLRHPLTVQAQKEMSDLLKRAGVCKKLIVGNPIDVQGNSRRTDEYTSAVLTLSPKLSGPGVGAEICTDESQRTDPSQYGIDFDQFLTVSYRGLILNRAGHTLRARQLVHIAERSMDDENVWLPDTEMITIEEWNALAEAPQRLLEYKKQNPDFSAEHCAVVHYYH